MLLAAGQVKQYLFSYYTTIINIYTKTTFHMAFDCTRLYKWIRKHNSCREDNYKFLRDVIYSLDSSLHHAVWFTLGWVVGSLELLFNPTGIVRSFMAGFSDLVLLPYQGLSRGPGAFVTGVGEGVTSVVRNVTSGELSY